MTAHRRIVILHPVGGPPADLASLVQALESEGAEVHLVECDPSYERALDAIESADRVVFWR